MLDQLVIYIFLFSAVVALGYFFQKSAIPLALILLIFGMLASFIPFIPVVELNPEVVLDIFLPLLIYQISAFSSWRDVKKQLIPIASLSIGHVVFITIMVAIVIHALIPQMGWPLAFVLGAIISPPDDIAIVAIAEKIRLPERVFIILEGEGMFNDAAALILFRFALAAAITHTFSIVHAFSAFLLVIIGESLYGFFLGHLLGKIRKKIKNSTLHMIASLLTPFLAYVPVVMLGGTGVLATAVVGFLIGNHYAIRFTPEFRLVSMALWPMIGFAIEGLIFLLVGLDMRNILTHISIIPLQELFIYVISIIAVVIAGRFFWVYATIMLFRKTYSFRNAFLVAWAGIRGGISLAAALAIPVLYFQVDGVNLRDFLIFLVLCVIVVTFVLQGLSLPYFIRKMGFDKTGQTEKYNEHLSELNAKVQITNAAFEWLQKYKKEIRNDQGLEDEVEYHIHEYQALVKKYQDMISTHKSEHSHDEKKENKASISLLMQIVKVEKIELIRLWRDEKINLQTRNKLLLALDHHVQRSKLG